MANFFVFVLLIVTIATLAIIGATFLGIVISHRILSQKGFTPFEEEMLKMREDVKEIKEKLALLEIKDGKVEANGGKEAKLNENAKK
ncbi:MAG: hypothetical protein QXT63_07255 [Thermoplasmata archaeon]